MGEAMSGLLDFFQSASNTVADNVAGPVDLISWGLRKAGVPVGPAPVGGSEWMRQQGLTRPVQQSAASLAGETAGLLAPTMIAAKAPQIAGGLLQMADNAMAPRTLHPQAGAIVWHGSPHKFDKFDSSKIGTGEGAQAYGHGLYLSENPKVADEYAGKLSKSIVEFKNSVPENEYERALQAKYQSLADRTQLGSKFQAIYNAWVNHANPVRDFLYGNSYAGVKPMSPEQLKTALAYRDAAKRLGEPVLSDTGSLYKVDLPDEAIAKMLDWDKPLRNQSPELQALAKQHGVTDPNGEVGGVLGQGLYQALGDGKASVLAAEKLRALGIPGIRYLDGGSRGAGSGTSNYVVFPGNEDLLTILERNGQGLLGQ